MAEYEILCRLFTARCIYDTLMAKPNDTKLQRTFHRVLERIGEWINIHPPSTVTKHYIQSFLSKLYTESMQMQSIQLLDNISKTL